MLRCNKGFDVLNVKKAKAELKEAQKKLREHIVKVNADEGKERFYGKYSRDIAGRGGVNNSSIDNYEKSDIIESRRVSELEQAKKRDHKIYITDTAIDKVGKVELSDFSESQVNDMQNKHKELLIVTAKNSLMYTCTPLREENISR